MSKPVGGRGHKAPYQTVIVRIPVDIKPQIEALAARFREGDLVISKNEDSDTQTIVRLTKIIERYQDAAKSSRDWVQAQRLIRDLTAELDRT
jgi:hypothetical protein